MRYEVFNKHFQHRYPIQVMREMFFRALSLHRQRTDEKKQNKKNNMDAV